MKKTISLILTLIFCLQVAAAESPRGRIIRTWTAISLSAPLLLLHFSSVADAAIRIIGKGGGYAEMVALTVLSRIPHLAMSCQTLPGHCGLSEAEQSLLSQLIELGVLDTKSAELEFFSDSSSADEIRYLSDAKSLVLLSSRHLYLADQKPAPMNHIASQVLHGWLLRPESTSIFADDPAVIDGLKTLSQKLAQNFKASEQTLRLEQSDRSLHVLESTGTVRLLLEENKVLTDLTELLRQQACAEDGEILGLNELFQDHGVVVGRLKARCGQSSFAARMLLEIPQDGKPRIHIVAKKSLCEAELAGLQ